MITDILAVEIPDYPNPTSHPHPWLQLSKSTSLGSIISALLPHILIFAGLAMLIMIVYGGFQLMISGGDSEGIREGKAKITWGVIGFLIVFSSYFIVQLVGTIFKVKIF